MVVKVSKPELNLREKISELDKPSGIAGEAMLRAETPQEQFNLIGAGRRNILINGDFQVSQRGDFTTASSMPNAYKLDRWLCDRNGTATLQHTTGHDIPGTPAICKAVKLVQTVTGTNYLGVRQKIENPTQYVGRTITYSAWVRSNTPNARIEWYTQGTAQLAIGPGHSGNGEWEYLSFTATMTGNPSTNWYVDAFIDNGAYSNTTITAGDFIEFTMAQLEIGTVATPFEHRSYGEELALCQRYFCSSFPTGTAPAHGLNINYQGVAGWTTFSSTTARSPFIYYPVTMRATPSLTLYSCANDTSGQWGIYTGSWDGSSTQATDSTNKNFNVRINSGISGAINQSYLIRGNWTASSEL
jgi:hypothetical protein